MSQAISIETTKLQEKTMVLQEPKILTGAEIFIECLLKEGVDHIFGYPGGVILPIYDALFTTKKLRHYLVRHEQAAVHAAEGYARVTGKAGVALATSGPGATNTVTGITNAFYDSIPLVVFTGQVPTELIGNDAFQECDIVGITRPCTKHNFLVWDVKDLARTIKEAFHIATSGKPGPVLVDIPKDVSMAKCEFYYPEEVKLKGFNPNYEGHQVQIAKAIKLIESSERPVMLIGGGIISADAHEELTKFAETYNIPVGNTLLGKGGISEFHELSLGLAGMHGHVWTNKAIGKTDLLIGIGTRFTDRITGKLKKFCPNANIIHIDIDPCSINKNVTVHIPIVGHIKKVLTKFLENTDQERAANYREKIKPWLAEVSEWRQKDYSFKQKEQAGIDPKYVIERLQALTKGQAIITTDVGQHQMWAAQITKFDRPRRWVSSAGLGTMGFGFPAAMGAKMAFPNDEVICITSEGSIQMNIQEMATVVQYNIPVKIVNLNNGYLGMIKQWQEKIYNNHLCDALITAPDFVKLAEAYGAVGLRATKPEEVDEVLEKGLSINRPVFMDFLTDGHDAVYPWVPAGAAIDEMLVTPEDWNKGR